MNEHKLNYLSTSSFSKIIIFIVFGLVGLFLAANLSIRLKPQQKIPVISISFSWSNNNPRIIESEVTSKIEQSLSSIEGLIETSSITSKGQGTVRLEFSENTDIDKTTLYISSILRYLYSSFPKGTTFPSVVKQGIDKEDNEVLMSLSISGNQSKDNLYKDIEDIIKPKIAKIKGVKNIELYGIPEYRYVILCENSKLNKYDINIDQVKSTITSFFKKHNIGLISSQGNKTPIEISFKEKNNEIYNLLKLSIINKKNKVIHLKDLIKISLKENKLEGFKRFNGFDALTMHILTDKKKNQLTLSKKLKKEIQLLNEQSSNNKIQINTLYDSTLKLKTELTKVTYRILFSLGVLFLFVFVISRNYKYVMLILVSLILNILIAIVLYYLFSIDIHLYSLAGLTISLGIMIDNTIIMVDHLLNQKNKKAFIPILAATITTIGALSIIFFIRKEYQLYLFDFSWIIIINLLTSLLVAFFLVPSLYNKFKISKKDISYYRRKKTILLSNIYRKILEKLITRKKLVFIFFVFLFGLPLFLIPKEVSENSEVNKKINLILKSEFYKKNISSNFKYLGGTLYTFIKSTEKGSFISSPNRTSIKIRLFNPEGGTIEQLNYAVKSFEKVLLNYKEVDSFLTEVYSANNGFIEIFIKEEYEKSDAPYILKNKLESIAIQIGGIDCSIFGVGNPFNNSGNLNSDATIKLKGYNLDNLLDKATEIKNSILLKHRRISNVKINSEKSWILKDKYEYKLKLKSNDLFSKNRVNNNDLINYMKWNSGNEIPISILNKRQVVIAENRNYLSSNKFEEINIKKDSTTFTLGQIATIQKENVINNVVKKNGDYEVFLDYSFAGTFVLSNSVRDELIKKINDQLQIGYIAINPADDYYMKEEKNLVLKIFLVVILVIYFICSILFESLLLPFAIILTIPCSFIGVFLTFSIFDIPFDQGGLASFIMLSGIVVNSSIYILNQYQNLKKEKEPSLSTYIKAFNMKIIPIALTIISTILGLIPFIAIEGNDFFWTSFAYGNIGGLIFSFFVILFFLPLCLKLKTSEV